MTAAPEGFGEFVAARGLALQRTALLLTQDVQLAEDLVQTALAKAWPRWKRIDHPESYVRQIIAHEFYRDRKRRWSADGEALTDRAARQDSLIRALRALPPQQRAVVVLRHVHDRPARSTADTLGTTANTVESHEADALEALAGHDLGALHDYADSLTGVDAEALVAGAERRSRQRRRTRTRAAVAGGAAVVMVAAAGVALI